MSLVLFSQLPSSSDNHRDIKSSSPNKYPTHIVSHNHYHHMCICEDVVSQKSRLYIHSLPFGGLFMIPRIFKNKELEVPLMSVKEELLKVVGGFEMVSSPC